MSVPKHVALIGLGFLTLMVLGLAFLWPVVRYKAQVARTRASLQLVAAAARSYCTSCGSWPRNLTELTTTNNPKGLVFLLARDPEVMDGWGRPVKLKPYDPVTHSGAVQSQGYDREGRPVIYEVSSR